MEGYARRVARGLRDPDGAGDEFGLPHPTALNLSYRLFQYRAQSREGEDRFERPTNIALASVNRTSVEICLSMVVVGDWGTPYWARSHIIENPKMNSPTNLLRPIHVRPSELRGRLRECHWPSSCFRAELEGAAKPASGRPAWIGVPGARLVGARTSVFRHPGFLRLIFRAYSRSAGLSISSDKKNSVAQALIMRPCRSAESIMLSEIPDLCVPEMRYVDFSYLSIERSSL